MSAQPLSSARETPRTGADAAQTPATPRDHLFDALAQQHELLAQEVTRSVRAAIPSYAGVDPVAHVAGSMVTVSLALSAARSGGAEIDRAQMRELIAVSRERSSTGVPLEDMVRGWHQSCRIIVDRARVTGAEMGISQQTILDLVDGILLVTEHAHRLVHEAHRADTLAAGNDDERLRRAFVLAALRGTLPASRLLEQAASFELDVDRPHRALRVRPTTGLEFGPMRQMLGLERARPAREGMAAELDGDLVAIVVDPPRGELPRTVGGIGEPVPLVELPESFRLAGRALRAAATFGLTGIHDIGSLGLRPAVIDDQDVGRALGARYLDRVVDDPSGEDLLNSLRGWFAAGMHVRRAASELFVHPNTLRYRISRFETLTGADLRDHQTAFEVWWALEHQQIARRSQGTVG